MLNNVLIWISIIQGVVTIIVLPAGVVLAWYGLTTWKDQMNTKAEYDLARSLLFSVCKIRDAITKCRLDIDMVKDLNKFEMKQIQEPRIKELSDARRELDVELIEANLMLDPITTVPFLGIGLQVRKLELA